MTYLNQPAKENKNPNAVAHDADIVDLILLDHKPLKELITVLKDADKPLEERKAAFEIFAIELVTHAKPEEQVLYVKMKANPELRVEGLEGDVEHGLADQLLEEAKRTTDDDLWTARVKVVAELVEHHIEEEEEELLPDFKKNSSVEERKTMSIQFLKLKNELIAKNGEDSQHESEIEPQQSIRH